jgi:hypothetical protein
MESERRDDEATEPGSKSGSPANYPPGGDVDTKSALEEMAHRVGDLERGYTRLLETENDRLRAALQSSLAPRPVAPAPRETADLEGSSAALHMPAYLATAVVEVERRCDEMEMYARLEDWAAARSAKLGAANIACRTLRRVSKDGEFAAQLRQLSAHARECEQQVLSAVPASGGPSAAATPAAAAVTNNNPEWPAFLEKEVELLQLVGLTHELAQEHVSRGREAFMTDPKAHLAKAQNPEQFMDLLEMLGDEVCLTADVVALGIRSAKSRQRWKKILVNGVGGTLILGANAGATVLLGPLGVAISGGLGSAAVGVAVAAANE